MKKLKKICIIVIAVSVLLIALISLMGGDSKPQTLKDYDISQPINVLNDKTGKWKYCITNTTTPTDEYAARLYKELKESENEDFTVLYVINFTLNTTTVVRQTTENYVEVETHDRVEHEELDAATMGSGTKISDDIYDIDTGEKVKL